MSSTIEPRASCVGRPAPTAAAMGSLTMATLRAPAPSADSRMARRSTWVEPKGTQTSTRGEGLQEAVAVHLLDEVLQHLLGVGEVGDHAVLHAAARQ